jgi:hypothetical protein
MFSTDADYMKSKGCCPALAILLIREEKKEVWRANCKKSGLHTFTTGAEQLAEETHGVESVSEVAESLKSLMSLSWHLLTSTAMPIPFKLKVRRRKLRKSCRKQPHTLWSPFLVSTTESVR